VIRACAVLAASIAASAPGILEAQSALDWHGAGATPLPSGAQSAVVAKDDEPLFMEPSSASARRGSAIRGARLPLFGARLGPGCRLRWLSVGPSAWLCEERATLSPEAPLAFDAPVESTPLGLPYRYFFVAKDGSFGYRALETAEEGSPDVQLRPSFGIAVSRVSNKKTGDPFGLTSRGFWVPMRDLAPVDPVGFQGVPWSAATAWVVKDATPLFSAPGRRRPGATLSRLTVVSVQEVRDIKFARYYRVGDKDWLRAEDVVQPVLAPPPADLRPGERWIDVDLTRQTLVVYIGEAPVFATLVSTGIGALGSEAATPTGSYRIWVKLRTSDMDNLENVQVRENYAIEAVPWVMFFHKGYGLHGTFWHSRFGETRSHGCVNLAPRDAERVFHWTSPRLLPGFSAIHPTAHEPGTLVRVHAD
jgi:hypothetical protein